MSARQNLSRATHFGLRDKGLLISSVVCRHGGCHLALLGREMARLLQANDSLPMKRIADASRRCMVHTASRVCQSLLSDGFGSLPDLRAAFFFWGALAPGRRLGCTRSLHLSSHPRAGGGVVRIASVASVATPPPLPAVCDYRTQVLCVMIDRLCHHALRNSCLSGLCARSTPRGRTSVPDNIGQSQSRQASMSPAKSKLARVV